MTKLPDREVDRRHGVITRIHNVVARELWPVVDDELTKSKDHGEKWSRMRSSGRFHRLDPRNSRETYGSDDLLMSIWALIDTWPLFEPRLFPILGHRSLNTVHAIRIQRNMVDHSTSALTSDREMARVLEDAADLLQAVGATSAALEIRRERFDYLAREYRAGAPGVAGSGVALSPVPAETLCVGVHWMEPIDGLPRGWWVAAIRDEHVEVLKPGLRTDEVAEYLSKCTASPHPTRVGLAYCFSCPAPFFTLSEIGGPLDLWESLESAGLDDASQLSVADLMELLPHPLRAAFWSPELGEAPSEQTRAQPYRKTEQQVRTRTGQQPSSVFQVGGPSSVGALALLGMPLLAKMHELGFALWPMDDPAGSKDIAVEIFPRALWAAVNPAASDDDMVAARALFLSQPSIAGLGNMGRGTRHDLQGERRAFDAFATAWALSQFGWELDSPSPAGRDRVEGKIWLPAKPAA